MASGRRFRRLQVLRIARAVWRYRGRLDAHGRTYQVELATALRSELDRVYGGGFALGTYRWAMRLLAICAGVLALAALAFGVALWREVNHASAVLALLPLVGAGIVLWWRLTWGAPLDWLDEHADTSRTLTARELPGRLRALAREARSLANVPGRLSEELEALANVAERDESGTAGS